jgi:phosphate transport system permease protein
MAAETPANQPAVATSAARGRVVLDGPPSLRERLLSAALRFCGLFTIGVTVGIVVMLVVESAGFFAEVSPLDFLGDTEWTPLHAHKHFGIWPLVSGTLLTTTIAVMVALPLGLAIAVYMSEIAKPRVRVYVKPVLEVLAGIPTVVYGYFALVFVTPALQTFIPGLAGFNALGPGLVMGFMILPIIASLADDALRAVPVHYREAGLALGATRLSTLFRVTLPAAGSGITAGVLLGIARALGETMIVAIAAGQQPRLTADPTVPIETMTAFIVQVSMGDTPAGSLEQRTIFAVGLALFVMTFLMNLVAFRLRQRILGRRS